MIHPSRQNRGFSLIELMFSMAIGALVLLLAASMLGASGDSYERIGGSVGADREARALITQLTSDLATGQFHKDQVSEPNSGSWGGDRLGILSLQPGMAQADEGRVGDLCAVNYYLKDLTVSGKTTRCLMRGFRSSNETFTAMRNGSLAPLFTESVANDEPVAFGVVLFEARPKSRDTVGKWMDWVKNDITGPEAYEVKLIVARRNLSQKLKKPADWTGSLLGSVSDADRNKDLERYSAIVRFGNHAKP